MRYQKKKNVLASCCAVPAFQSFFFSLRNMADHPNKVAFEQGLHYVLRSWTALNLAVEQDWGGVESADKRDWMNQVLVDYFGASKCLLAVSSIDFVLTRTIQTAKNWTWMISNKSWLKSWPMNSIVCLKTTRLIWYDPFFFLYFEPLTR